MKTTTTLLLLMTSTVAACGGDTVGPQGTGITSGLAAYWKLDGDATDSTGHGLNLSPAPGMNNGSLAFAPGKFGSGLYPRVSATNYLCGECVALESPTSPLLEFKDATTDDFTVSLWAKRSASPVVDGTWWGYALFDNGQVSLNAQATGASPTPAYPTLTFYNDGAVIASLQDTTFDFRSATNTDVWTHVIAFRRGDVIGLRINGKETTAGITGSVGTAKTFYVAQNAGGYPWQGVVDEVGKWQRALTGAEMDQLYSNGEGLKLP